jgi:tetratricopeptide (TPR) repeat protein
MKRMILTGIMAIGAGAMCLLAQAPPAAPAQAGAQKQKAPKSKGELETLQAMQAAANDPDKAIAACETLITKYADSDFVSVALYMEADAYQRKNDFDHMVIFAERTQTADPTDFRAPLMLARYYATKTRENDLDREEKLGKAEKLANQVIDMMKNLPKPNLGITDEQWVEVRKDTTAEGYDCIGMANLVRKKYDVAAAAFKQAVEAASHPEPAYMVRQASALQMAGKNDEAIVMCDKVMAVPDVHPQIKSVATAIRAAAVKAGGKAPGGGAE